jgi:hypothetical protein
MRTNSGQFFIRTLGLAGLSLSFATGGCDSAAVPGDSFWTTTTSRALSGAPKYDHVFLVISENHRFDQIIGNPAAPIINALASDYGLATAYTGVSDPSEPNYVAMLGGSDFGISSDDPYFFPAQTVDADNLMSQLDAAGKTWRGYFQDMPYPGYRGWCFPGKCNGIPDSDTQYVAKHNGIPNFVNMRTPASFAKQRPLEQLKDDLASGNLPNFGYIVGDECNDMHGAPPYCVDSGNPGDNADNWLVGQGDKFIGQTVDMITHSAVWSSGNNAIVLTWDEGDVPTDLITTIVVTSHGPRGLMDSTPYSHYSLLATLQNNFGLPCLLNSCTANLMTPLFQVTGSSGVVPLPPPFNPPPNGDNSVSPVGTPVAGPAIDPDAAGWTVVKSPTIPPFDNVLASVSAGSSKDAWAVGEFYSPTGDGTVLNTFGEHFDGTRWTAYPLPNVGSNLNALFSVSELPSGETWAVGYYVDAHYSQHTLTEHFDGTTWTVVPSPSPGARQNILYGVAALSSSDVWAVGGSEDAGGTWHALAEHWDGDKWRIVPAVDAGSTGNVFYSISASSSRSVFAVGIQAGTSFPSKALAEQWDGEEWEIVSTPTDPGGTDVVLGVTASGSSVTLVGDRESSTAPYTTLVASGGEDGVSLTATPNSPLGENDLFSATTAADGTTWAVGWVLDLSTGNHVTITEDGVNGSWSIVRSPNPNVANGDDGLSSVTAIPGGGLWAVGVSTDASGNYATLILHHR